MAGVKTIHGLKVEDHTRSMEKKKVKKRRGKKKTK
jgi:hypothetical protein